MEEEVLGLRELEEESSSKAHMRQESTIFRTLFRT